MPRWFASFGAASAKRSVSRSEHIVGHDHEELKFCGRVSSLAESDYSASFAADDDNSLMESIWADYVAAGKPKPRDAWICNRLADLFTFVTEPPQWVEKRSSPRWPIFNGKPMVFIHQYSVPENKVPNGPTSTSVLYVFGCREALIDVEDGWEMRYVVKEQLRDLL